MLFFKLIEVCHRDQSLRLKGYPTERSPPYSPTCTPQTESTSTDNYKYLHKHTNHLSNIIGLAEL